MYEQNASHLVKLTRIKGKKFEQNMSKKCLKITQMAFAVLHFQKILGKACLWIP